MYTGRDDAVLETAVVFILHIEHAHFDDKELQPFAEGIALSWRVASRAYTIEQDGARVTKKVRIAEQHLLSQSVQHLVYLEVFVQNGGVNAQVAQ